MFARIALIALALISFVNVARAGETPLYGPSPAWVLAPPPLQVTNLTDSDPMILRFDQQVRFQPDGELWIHGDMAMRMLSPQMLTAAGTIALPWSPERGDVTIHAVEIYRNGERIDVIAAGQRFTVLRREEGLERASLNGMLTATLAVEGLRVGDVMRVAFSTRLKDANLGGNVQAFMPLLSEPVRAGFGRVRMVWPSTMPMHWRSLLRDAPVQTSEQGGYREISVSLPLTKPAEMPNDAPMRFQSLPLLEASSFDGWASVVKTMAPLFNGAATAIPPGSPLAAEVAKIAAASADPRTRAAMALRLVQNEIRYLFKGMDNGNYTPQTPAETWSLRYGDCKAKSVLLVAMLRALGIEADPAMVSATAGDVVPLRLPSPGVFDHIIVRAVIGGETLWLDGTAAGARLADLGDVPPFRWALPLRDGVTDLVAMPLRANARPDLDAVLEIDQRAGIDFAAPFKLTAQLRGQNADLIRMAAATGSDEQTFSMIDAVLTAYVGTSQTIDHSYAYDEESGVMTVTVAGVTFNRFEQDGARRVMSLDTWGGDMNFAPDRARPAWREIPVSSGDPANQRLRVIVRLPNRGAGFTLDGNQTLPAQLAGMTVTRTTSMAEGVVTVDDHVISGINEIAPADIPAMRQQVAQAKTRLLRIAAPADTPPDWQQIEIARRARAFDPILALYARGIARDANKAEPYVARATFLASIYDRRGALADLDKAIAIAPTAEIYVTRAAIRHAMGNDAGAIADLRAALELDPGATAATGLLATYLAEEGKLEEALALADERIAAGGSGRFGFIGLKAGLLGRAGRAEEGIALLDAALAETPGNPAMLNQRCWIKGTANLQLDTALRDCTRSIELADNPAHVMDSRAMVYFRMGRTEEALADLEAALRQEPNLAASLFMRGVIRRSTGDRAGGDADLAAARMIEPRIDEEYARFGIRP